MARELAPDGIRVNDRAQQWIDNDIFQGQLSAERREQVPPGYSDGAARPGGRCRRRMPVPCLDLSSYVTGAVIDVNGEARYIH